MIPLLVKPAVTGAGELLCVTQERAGWQTVSLRLVRLEKGHQHVVSQPEEELALVMLGGRAAVESGEQRWPALGGRENVFSGMPHALYLPVGTERVEIEALTDAGEVAVCGARAQRRIVARDGAICTSPKEDALY